MASYNTDLNLVNAADSATGWSEMSGHTSGGAPSADTENYLQNSISVSQSTGQATGTNAGMEYDYGSAITWTSGDVFLFWQYYTAPTNMQTWANGGMRVGVGSSSGNMRFWNAMGDDFSGSPYACWQNTAINPEVSGDGTDDGTPTAGSYSIFGSLPNVRAKITKGNPHAVDIIRYGRGEIYGTGTDATFSGYATANDGTTARWGLFQAVRGGYLWKGLFSLGQTATSITFSDSNSNIFIDDTPRVSSGFNKIEVNNSSSSVTWTGINITGVGTSITGSAPVSPGDFEVVDNATIAFTSCSFTDMGTFTFNDGTNSNTITGTVFRRCGLVTSGGATFTGCNFDAPSGTVGITASSPADAALITGTSFTSSGSGHGLEITGTAADITLTDLDFSGYDTADPGTAANKAIYVNIATGSMTINISGGSGVSQDYHVRSAGATVTVSADTSVTFTNLKDNTEVRIYKVSDDSVVAGTENATAGTTDERTYTWSAASSTEVYYMIINKEYEIIRVESYTVPSTNASIQVFQRIDRNYSNP